MRPHCQRDGCRRGEYLRGLCEPHYEVQRQAGVWGKTSTERVRAHLSLLRAWGWGDTQIGEATGLKRSSVWRLRERARGQVQRETERAILAIEPNWCESALPVSALGSYRRIDALRCMGHTQLSIETQVGLKPYTLTDMRYRGNRIAARYAARITRVYDELKHIPGPCQATATYAYQQGCAPPLAWDDIDDPNERPIGVRGHSGDRLLRVKAKYRYPKRTYRHAAKETQAA